MFATGPALLAGSLIHPRPLQHRMQQHIAPGRNMLGLGVLNFVVADAIFAWDEDHFRRRESRHVNRILPRI